MAIAVIVTRDLATMTSYIDPSVRIVTKSPKVGPLLIFSISLAETISSDLERRLLLCTFGM
jgi:hypothetical protein